MVGGLGALGALGSIGSGIESGLDADARRRLLQQQSQQLAQQNSGAAALGAGLSQFFTGSPGNTAVTPQSAVPFAKLLSMFGGGQPQGGQQPPAGAMPAPPQARAPMPGGPQPQAQPTPPPQGQGQGQGGAPPPQTQAALQQLDFPSLVRAIKQAKPNITDPELIAALDRAVPYINAQAAQAYKQALLGIQSSRVQETQRHDTATEGTAATRADTGAAAQAEKERADKAREDLEGKRIKASASHFQESLSVMKEKLALAESATSKREAQTALADAERERNRAYNLIQNEMLYGANDADADAKKKQFQSQLDAADKAITAAKAGLAGRPDNWEGKDQGRAPPEEAKPLPSTGDSPVDKLKKAMAGGNAPVKVTTPEEAMKLPKGTVYTTPDGQTYTR